MRHRRVRWRVHGRTGCRRCWCDRKPLSCWVDERKIDVHSLRTRHKPAHPPVQTTYVRRGKTPPYDVAREQAEPGPGCCKTTFGLVDEAFQRVRCCDKVLRRRVHFQDLPMLGQRVVDGLEHAPDRGRILRSDCRREYHDGRQN